MKLNLNNRKKQGGFALIEVIAAAALIGILVTMLMPSLSGANARVKNAKLKNDLATVDQAIQLYVLDKGSMPSTLSQLHPDYIVNKDDFKDATNTELSYTPDNSNFTYTLTGKDASGTQVTSNGSTTQASGEGNQG